MRNALLIAFALACGCAGEGRVGYSAGYAYSTPDLEYVAPGVQVVADADVPLFYSDGFYWRFDNGYWYRSPYYNRGWAYTSAPVFVGRIGDPYAYRHYHHGNNAWARSYYRNNGGYQRPVYRAPAPRTYQARPHANVRARGRVIVRDHR